MILKSGHSATNLVIVYEMYINFYLKHILTYIPSICGMQDEDINLGVWQLGNGRYVYMCVYVY